jgi:hypothetical protein
MSPWRSAGGRLSSSHVVGASFLRTALTGLNVATSSNTLTITWSGGGVGAGTNPVYYAQNVPPPSLPSIQAQTTTAGGPIVVSGLNNGTLYTLYVYASDDNGDGSYVSVQGTPA